MNRKEIVNGQRIPYESETEDLIRMLGSQDMATFCLACEVLSYRSEEQAYSALSSFLMSKDYFRRLYAFQVIFRNPRAVSLQWYLDKQLSSDDLLFVKAALRNIMEHQLSCSQDKLKAAISTYSDSLRDEYWALNALEISESNYQFQVSLLSKVHPPIVQEIVATVLIQQYEDSHPKELFQMLSGVDNPKLRVMAVCIGKTLGIDMGYMLNDKNGHVRNAVRRVEHLKS